MNKKLLKEFFEKNDSQAPRNDMEVGEIREVNRIRVVAEERSDTGCEECIFVNRCLSRESCDSIEKIFGECDHDGRYGRKDIIFKEVK